VDLGTISPKMLEKKLLSGQQLTLIDVREHHERQLCLIQVPEGVANLHIPMAEIQARLSEIRECPAPIVVYCHHGIRSMVVARWLAVRGVSGLWNLEGGIDSWSSDVDPGVPTY
jgi:rhodanese-related sulfurtransferase